MNAPRAASALAVVVALAAIGATAAFGTLASAPAAGPRTAASAALAGTEWSAGTGESAGTGGAAGGESVTPTGTTETTVPSGEEAAPTPCMRHPRWRCPDLTMSAPYDLHIDRTTIRGHVLLRAASSINNHGTGPMELRVHRTPHGWAAYQAIYDRHRHAHLFRTAARLIYKYVPGERYEHPTIGAFSYWKLRHAASFQLWSIDRKRHALRLVRTGPKVDYCLRDLYRTDPLPFSPQAAVYPACSQNPHIRRDVLGTSVGWSDIYPYEYPQQWIDVTGLHGRFAFVETVDPDNLLIESNHKNDISETYVSLPSGRILGHRVGVAHP